MAGTITALKFQQRNKERVNVYLDGEFAFGLAATEAAHLRKGQSLSDGEIASLQAGIVAAEAQIASLQVGVNDAQGHLASAYAKLEAAEDLL